MKKILSAISISFITCSAWADCNRPKTSFEVDKCLSDNVKELNKDLNIIYNKLYKKVKAKKELDEAQKAWLKYKVLQCNSYNAIEKMDSPAYSSFSMLCESELIIHRVSFLKNELQ